jgi:uncharacterized cupin superfamily protein
MKRFNLNTAETTPDPADPDGYRSAANRFGPSIGASQMGGTVYDLPPGQSICPYHYEYDEEWLFVLAGTPLVRTPEGEERLDPGDVVCFVPGPEGAHKVTNDGGEDAGTVRVLMLSTITDPAIAFYPDSDKVGVFNGRSGDEFRLLFPRGSGVDYFEGEV